MTVMITGDLPRLRNQGPGMRSHFTTIKLLAGTTTFNAPKTAPLQKTATCPLQGRGVGHFPPQRLKSIGAIISANLSAMLTSLGAVICTVSVALADDASDSIMVPLQHVQDEQGAITWLGTAGRSGKLRPTVGGEPGPSGWIS
jgi:hypothetical protein